MDIAYLPFQVTNEFPSCIVADFDTFLARVQAPSSHLTKARKWINRATLYALNKEMKTFTVNESPRTDQIYYPLLDFFYHIALSAGFFRVVKVKSKYRLQSTEILSKYQEFHNVEKYLALFEAFWVYADWHEMLQEQSHATMFGIPEDDSFTASLSNLPCDKTITAAQVRKQNDDVTVFGMRADYFYSPSAAYVIRFLSFFGVLTYKLKKQSASRMQNSKGYIVLKSISITPFGGSFLQILNSDRQFTRFNKPLLFTDGEEYPGQEPAENQPEPEPFFTPFTKMLVAGNAPKKGLSIVQTEYQKGTFIFKVTLDDAWRTIAISGRNTLEDLHLAIQAAFDFDNDHLYSFSLDPKRLHPRKSYHSPNGEEAPFADSVRIGRLNLYAGQKLLYVFDYGDWWEFSIEVVKITDKPHFGDSKILEQKGKNPEQYPDYDE